MQNDDAINELGIKYSKGIGVPVNYVAAMNYFKKAAHMGNLNAMVNIGKFYQAGAGVIQNDYEALGWYKAAANKGNVEAMYLTARLYHENNNNKLAMDFYAKAASFGYQKAVMELGQIYEEHSYFAAVKYYRIFAEKGNGEAMCTIGRLYSTGDKSLSENKNEALKWFFLAFEAKYTPAIWHIGKYLKDLNDHKNAFQWFKKGAESGNFDCMVEVGLYYMNGLGTSQDFDKAKKWLYKAKSLAQEIDKNSGENLLEDYVEHYLQILREYIRAEWSW